MVLISIRTFLASFRTVLAFLWCTNCSGHVNMGKQEVYCVLCHSRKYPYPPHGRLMEIPRGRRVSKVKFFEWKYDTKGEFPEGWRFNLKNFPWEGYGYFLEQHIFFLLFFYFFVLLLTARIHVSACRIGALNLSVCFCMLCTFSHDNMYMYVLHYCSVA